ncbi:MAG: hypothetical protein Q8879_02875, partial [Candidatus Phytoplasma australasiaticum]|nr:hypothetical protein [Candidatus Phytoplasma australasiaticum]
GSIVTFSPFNASPLNFKRILLNINISRLTKIIYCFKLINFFKYFKFLNSLFNIFDFKICLIYLILFFIKKII